MTNEEGAYGDSYYGDGVYGYDAVRLDVQTVVGTGIQLAYTGSLSVGNVYRFRNATPKTFLHARRGAGAGAGSATIVLGTPDVAVGDISIVVPGTNGDKMVGPLPRSPMEDDMAFTVSGDLAGLVVAVIGVS